MHQMEFFGVASEKWILVEGVSNFIGHKSKDVGEIFHHLVPLHAMDPRGTT
jgi:hypothetical protein